MCIVKFCVLRVYVNIYYIWSIFFLQKASLGFCIIKTVNTRDEYRAGRKNKDKING